MAEQNTSAAASAYPDGLPETIKDYSEAVVTLTWQKQGIFAAIALLTGIFFDPLAAVVFFAVGMVCEYIDLGFARLAARIDPETPGAAARIEAGYIANTVLSAFSIGIYAVLVGTAQDGAGLFTALFCLFAAALYAAMNNHQIASTLAIRLTVYSLAFLALTLRDLWIYRPPLTSVMWLQFFTVTFVMYFLIDCSLGFLRRYRQNLRQLDELRRALELKSQFIAVVSHELRTPLTSVKGSLDLVNSGRFGPVSEQMQQLLQLAGKNSDRLTRLVDDLLDLQKLEAGSLRFENETIEMGAFMSDVLAAHQGLAQERDLRLDLVAVPAGPVHIHADPGRMMQVMGNILSNAAKFSPAGGDIEIGCAARGGHVRIFVRDHGIGIPEGSKQKVFDRFSQIDSSDQRAFGGIGLGMNISREIVEAAGGTIDYDSEPGKGTIFFIDLPCAGVSRQESANEGGSENKAAWPVRM
ncbi:ATP-binding protein [Marivita sp. GX14005]|uniref:sensor histidine kinase n=1 Tax=Marivita sp. GX14005 TaxID=2942276 RepID=UPI0020195604|nr:ATP-binding protein [Marivita sp. GX14005]MCL3883948.1 ATP-binding protein [Marivita sp. GX14005]